MTLWCRLLKEVPKSVDQSINHRLSYSITSFLRVKCNRRRGDRAARRLSIRSSERRSTLSSYTRLELAKCTLRIERCFGAEETSITWPLKGTFRHVIQSYRLCNSVRIIGGTRCCSCAPVVCSLKCTQSGFKATVTLRAAFKRSCQAVSNSEKRRRVSWEHEGCCCTRVRSFSLISFLRSEGRLSFIFFVLSANCSSNHFCGAKSIMRQFDSANHQLGRHKLFPIS